MSVNVFSILSGLNPEQRAVVTHIDGSYFVLSGPGSGKTKCLVSRTQYMLYKGVLPESIMLFTFTVKAANEIKERIAEVIDSDIANKITIGTYHSVCLKILKKYYTSLKLFKENFTIYDQTDKNNILKELCTNNTYNIDVPTIANYISNQKDNLLCPEDSYKNASTQIEQAKAQLYENYQKVLIRNNAIDFDDIIFYTIQILQSFPNIRKTINSQYQYIISDESQDASTSNIELLKLLSHDAETNSPKNLCMFLDDDQSIYGFRGANLNAILNIPNNESQMQVLYLNRNYRSTPNIVNAALSVINNNKKRCSKELFTTNNNGTNITYFEKYNADQEAKNVINTISYLINKNGLKYNDIAILYRNNTLSRPIETVLMQNNIPYTIKNGMAFFEYKEIKDVLAYIRFILNNYDDEAFKRIINIPSRGIGKATINKIELYVNEHHGTNIIECCKQMISAKMLSKKVCESLSEFIDYIESNGAAIDNYSPADFVTHIIQTLNYSIILKNEDADNFAERYTNILQLITIASGYIDIRDFINNTSLLRTSDNDTDNSITLTTMHGCKGLEWKAVFMVGLNDNIIPGRSNIEEERRLFYVAMTRAKEYLFLSRSIFNTRNNMASERCRFINEIDNQYLYDTTSNNKISISNSL